MSLDSPDYAPFIICFEMYQYQLKEYLKMTKYKSMRHMKHKPTDLTNIQT